MVNILKCPKCYRYTMKAVCPNCREKTINIRPPKFSLEDKFAHYRRETKRMLLKEKGLL